MLRVYLFFTFLLFFYFSELDVSNCGVLCVPQAVSVGDQYSITFTSQVKTVVVEHSKDRHTDMFQVCT